MTQDLDSDGDIDLSIIVSINGHIPSECESKQSLPEGSNHEDDNNNNGIRDDDKKHDENHGGNNSDNNITDRQGTLSNPTKRNNKGKRKKNSDLV